MAAQKPKRRAARGKVQPEKPSKLPLDGIAEYGSDGGPSHPAARLVAAIKAGREGGTPKGRGRGESDTSPRMLDALEKQVRATTMRRQGYTYQKIADALGYADASGAYDAVHALMEKATVETADEMVKRELERLDEMTQALYDRAVEYGDIYAVDRIVKLMERRAKLAGLDAPEKREISGRGGSPLFAPVDYSAMTEDEIAAERERIRLVKEAAERSAALDDED